MARAEAWRQDSQPVWTVSVWRQREQGWEHMWEKSRGRGRRMGRQIDSIASQAFRRTLTPTVAEMETCYGGAVSRGLVGSERCIHASEWWQWNKVECTKCKQEQSTWALEEDPSFAWILCNFWVWGIYIRKEICVYECKLVMKVILLEQEIVSNFKHKKKKAWNNKCYKTFLKH